MTSLQSLLFWILVFVFAGVVAFVIRKTVSNRPWGFKDIVKNPGIWDAMAEGQQRVERDIQAAQNWDVHQIARATWHFIFEVKTGRNAWGELRILKAMGARVHPVIIDILKDPSVRPRLTVPTGIDLLPEAPLDRLCDLLEENPPAEAVELLIPFLDDPSSQIRKNVALVLGNVGTSNIATAMRKAFSDADEYVRSYALMGLERAVNGQHLDARCQRELFDDLQKLISEGKNADNAAALLLEFDKERATEFFLSPVVFTSDSTSLHEALEALADRKVPVPRDRLLTLIDELEQSKLEYPWTYTLGGSLRLLGQLRQPEDRHFLELRTTNADEAVAQGAAAGLLAMEGLENFRQKLWDKEKAVGFSSLSDPERHFSAVTGLDGQVNNGGFSQYFVNSDGNDWRDALAGLDAMGCKERAAILREALGKFGSDGPATERETRQQQLARHARANDALFDSLDTRYYECTEVVEVVATRYVIRNAEAFK